MPQEGQRRSSLAPSEGQRRGSLLPPEWQRRGSLQPGVPCGERRPSMGMAAAAASLEGLAAKVAGKGGRVPSRMSMVVPGSGAAHDSVPRRGSLLIGGLGVEPVPSSGGSVATPLHPGLNHIRSFQ